MKYLAFSALLLSSLGLHAEEVADPWPALKASWAKNHLKLAGEMLKADCIGFADTQAGMATQLVGAEDAGVQAYEEKRAKMKLPDKGWLEADWKAYEAKRSAMHHKEAKEAAALLVKGEPPEAAAVEAWALRLDPDQPEVRKRRGEVQVPGMGWLPQETAKNLKAGLVRFGDVWEKPDPGKYVAWDKAYMIPTEHYLFKTTLPLKTVLENAAALEGLYRIWEEIFEGVTRIWGRKEPPVVWMFKTSAEYQACVASEAPGEVEASKNPRIPGFAYVSQAFFFLREDPSVPVRPISYHECTHLIHNGIVLNNGGDAGLWCAEGMAVLMEPLSKGKVTDWNSSATGKNTFNVAEALSVLDGLPDLFAMERGAFQSEMGKHYEQSCVLCHFLMYGQGGVHRRDLLGCVLATQKREYGGYDAHFRQMSQKDLCALAKAYAKKAIQ